MSLIVIIAVETQESLVRAADRVSELEDYGFEPHVCIGPVALQKKLQNLHAERDLNGVLVVLDNRLRGNCAQAQLVSTLYPGCKVVSLLDDLGEDALIASLQSGADFCCAKDASAALLASVLYSLLRRKNDVPPDAPPPEPARTFWRLTQQGSVLEGPHGCTLALTTAERGFLLCLTREPGMRAAYETFGEHIDPQSAGTSPKALQGKMGVLVSRLRRKLQQQHGLELPVKSVHKWGYMFTGELRP